MLTAEGNPWKSTVLTNPGARLKYKHKFSKRSICSIMWHLRLQGEDQVNGHKTTSQDATVNQLCLDARYGSSNNPPSRASHNEHDPVCTHVSHFSNFKLTAEGNPWKSTVLTNPGARLKYKHKFSKRSILISLPGKGLCCKL